jgi:hypothetical protein
MLRVGSHDSEGKWLITRESKLLGYLVSYGRQYNWDFRVFVLGSLIKTPPIQG